jgi:hypothetical protein
MWLRGSSTINDTDPCGSGPGSVTLIVIHKKNMRQNSNANNSVDSRVFTVSAQEKSTGSPVLQCVIKRA